MRLHTLAAGIAAVALIPSLAMAQETCAQRSANRTTGTVLGVIGGALLGNALASHGGKAGGAVIGGVAGGVVGSNLAKGPHDCVHAYGYYDDRGIWHDNHADRAVAYGYYDRSGVWVDGAPPGVAGYAADAAYTGPTMSVDARMAQIDRRIRRDRDNNSLSGREARDATRTLNDIRREVEDRSGGGPLVGRDYDDVQQRLDALSAQIHMDRNGG
jgi:hypothetical protein